MSFDVTEQNGSFYGSSSTDLVLGSRTWSNWSWWNQWTADKQGWGGWESSPWSEGRTGSGSAAASQPVVAAEEAWTTPTAASATTISGVGETPALAPEVAPAVLAPEVAPIPPAMEETTSPAVRTRREVDATDYDEVGFRREEAAFEPPRRGFSAAAVPIEGAFEAKKKDFSAPPEFPGYDQLDLYELAVRRWAKRTGYKAEDQAGRILDTLTLDMQRKLKPLAETLEEVDG